MNSTSQFSDAKAFRYSLDWRFFVPVSETSKILYIGEGGEEVQGFFQRLKIYDISYLDASAVEDIHLYSALSSTFDVVSIPYNFVYHHLFREIKKILKPKGRLLLGIPNHYRSSDKNVMPAFKLKPLLLKAGFSKVQYYGAFSDEYAPQYIFPLNSHTLKFVMYHRYESRIPSWVLRFLSLPPLTFLLSYFIPAYYIVAQVGDV